MPRTFVRYSTEESLVNIAYEFTYTLIKNKHTDMKLENIYFFIYTKYIYVSNVLINLLLFELSNYRKVQFTK